MLLGIGPKVAKPSSWKPAHEDMPVLLSGIMVLMLSHTRSKYAILKLAEKFFQPDSLANTLFNPS